MQLDQVALLKGTIIRTGSRDHYVVEDVLGKGGFSTIYLVRDLRVKQNLFALKEINNLDKKEHDRLAFEVEVLTRVDHPALPRVYRVFEDYQRTRAYVLMDYIDGSNLELLRRREPKKRLSLSRMINIMLPIMDAITFLHCQEPPIMHRDIKPANIIVPTISEEPMLVDFGIAKVYESENTTTAVRHCSPGYAAPEQYGFGTTPLTDIYGLGATIYTLLTGTVPTDSLQRLIMLNNKGLDPLIPLSQLAPDTPLQIAEAVHRALHVNSNERFSSVEAFKQALLTGTGEQQSHQPRRTFSTTHRTPVLHEANVRDSVAISPPNRGSRFWRRWQVALLIPLLLLLVFVSGIWANNWLSSRSVPNSSPQSKITPMITPTPVVTPTPVLYPPLAEQYTGTINRMETNTKMNMLLAHIQQREGNIRGNFLGLNLTGPFEGTIDKVGHVQFQIAIHSGDEILSFDGNVQLGGNIAGSYQVLNRNRQFIGEYGLWSVAPATR